MRELGEKILGLFVVAEDDEKKRDEEDVVIDEDEVTLAPAAPLPPATPIKVDAGAGDEVKKVMDLIASLPDGAPLEVKRAIVTASLEAFGIRIERVLASAGQAERGLEEQARRIDQEISKQQRLAKGVAEERARLRAVGAFFGKS